VGQVICVGLSGYESELDPDPAGAGVLATVFVAVVLVELEPELLDPDDVPCVATGSCTVSVRFCGGVGGIGGGGATLIGAGGFGAGTTGRGVT
jgi:hypothetical protein